MEHQQFLQGKRLFQLLRKLLLKIPALIRLQEFHSAALFVQNDVRSVFCSQNIILTKKRNNRKWKFSVIFVLKPRYCPVSSFRRAKNNKPGNIFIIQNICKICCISPASVFEIIWKHKGNQISVFICISIFLKKLIFCLPLNV